MNLPNKLTILRVILIPFFVFFLISPFFDGYGNYIALAIFIIASLTDMADGKIARKYNLVTNFGKFMDPLADKLLVCSAMICLVDLKLIPVWVVLIIIAREFIISGFRLVASDNGIVIAASYWGKFKTTFQMLMVIVIIFNINLKLSWLNILGTILIYVALVLTVVSLIDYIAKNKDEDDKDIKERVKANILTILSQEYGVDEDDFLSAEIEVVPAGEARDYGLDRSMIMGYGHDDRVCAYPSYRAMLEIEGAPEYTSVCLLVDKEEIGSVGASGMQSRFFENCVAEVMNLAGDYSELAVRRALKNSKVLSSDVSAAFDPNYPSVMEKKNSAYFGKGLVFNKYTGARGKSGSNDANAEYVARLRNIMDTADVSFQTAELGKVDEGGGGTIAYILANYDMNVIDSGVPVLNMHAPWEIISKVDLYEAFRGYIAFLKEA